MLRPIQSGAINDTFKGIVFGDQTLVVMLEIVMLHVDGEYERQLHLLNARVSFLQDYEYSAEVYKFSKANNTRREWS